MKFILSGEKELEIEVAEPAGASVALRFIFDERFKLGYSCWRFSAGVDVILGVDVLLLMLLF